MGLCANWKGNHPVKVENGGSIPPGLVVMPSSSSGPGCRPFKPEDAGSNPAGGTALTHSQRGEEATVVAALPRTGEAEHVASSLGCKPSASAVEVRLLLTPLVLEGARSALPQPREGRARPLGYEATRSVDGGSPPDSAEWQGSPSFFCESWSPVVAPPLGGGVRGFESLLAD